MRPPATWEPWGAAKAKANFWKWFTIDLIVVSLVTYIFDLSAFWVSLFVVVPLGLRKRIIAFMMDPQASGSSPGGKTSLGGDTDVIGEYLSTQCDASLRRVTYTRWLS